MFEQYEKIIKERLSEYRFLHSMNVANVAFKLAKHYDVDTNNAYLAGLLHDITKEEKLDVQISLIEKYKKELSFLEKNNSAVLHQFSGAAFCKYELEIEDDDVLNSICYHTTGRRDMSMLEQIVYVADYISDEREYDDVEIMRNLAFENIDEAMLYSLKYTINKLINNNKLLHPNTIECYNWIIEKGLK